ncbi:MAG: hypothetical protein R3F61_35795 [Myxococcota bacterium]
MNVVYALGGGRGHATRALTLAARLSGPSRVLHQCADPDLPGGIGTPTVAELHARLAEALVGATRFVVDTFPGGVAHELGELPTGVRTVLVARYVDRSAYPRYDALAARFDEIWLPYDPDGCEWDDPPDGRYIGPVVRTVPLGPEVDTLVIGSGEPASWAPLLRDLPRVDGPFASLPRARRVVALSAGYNLGWELATAGIRTAFRPLPRRFDDQFRRAARLGTPLYHRSCLEGFLAC